MTAISRDDILHLAQLSSIQLADQEVAALGDDLGRILEYIEQLAELDTTGVKPTYQVNQLANVWRDDTPRTDGPSRESLLALAPARRDNSVEVPKVL